MACASSRCRAHFPLAAAPLLAVAAIDPPTRRNHATESPWTTIRMQLAHSITLVAMSLSHCATLPFRHLRRPSESCRSPSPSHSSSSRCPLQMLLSIAAATLNRVLPRAASPSSIGRTMSTGANYVSPPTSRTNHEPHCDGCCYQRPLILSLTSYLCLLYFFLLSFRCSRTPTPTLPRRLRPRSR